MNYKKFEYTYVRIDSVDPWRITRRLNDLGEEGWECYFQETTETLEHGKDTLVYLKREIPPYVPQERKQ